jgi:hypothetical protein
MTNLSKNVTDKEDPLARISNNIPIHPKQQPKTKD